MNTITGIVPYPDIKSRGNGKTCLMTALLYADFKAGRRIVANYELRFDDEKQWTLKELKKAGLQPHEVLVLSVTFEELARLPTWLKDCTVGTDELQVGADSRQIFKRSNTSIDTFAAQLRKRHVAWYYTTQWFKKVDKRIRQATDQIVMIEPLMPNKPEFFHLEIVDGHSYSMILEKVMDLRYVFPMYDTDEVIYYGDEEKEMADTIDGFE